MPKSTETSLKASSTFSSKAASLKKSFKKGAKSLARPFKKLKKTISTSTLRSTRSPSIATAPVSENDENNPIDLDRSDRSGVDSTDGHHSDSEHITELSPEEQLGTCYLFFIIIHANYIYTRGTQEQLAIPYLFIFSAGRHLPILQRLPLSYLHLRGSQV